MRPHECASVRRLVGGANTAANPTRQIGLAEAIQMALQSNLDIQVSRYNPQISQYALSEAFAVYEPDLRLRLHARSTTLVAGRRSIGRGSRFLSETSSKAMFGRHSVGNGIQGYAPERFDLQYWR
jgi:hypothetical protein